MAQQCLWYYTDLPEQVIDILIKELSKNFDNRVADSLLVGDRYNKDVRNSRNCWIPSNHWIGGFLWHYIQRANKENFLYDLRGIDDENIQYTHYGPGEYYKWHMDEGLMTMYKPSGVGDKDSRKTDLWEESTELIRKLSFSMQLSGPDDYEGGNLQFQLDYGECIFAPRQKGAVILFDSRLRHRVLPITKGIRKSLVGWCNGPRWR